VYSNLQFYLENATELTEEQIQEYIILHYKVQKHVDTSFSKTAKAYMDSNLEINGPKK